MKISIGAQIEEVGREIKMRLEVYPGLVRKGRYRQTEADMLVDRMRAAKATLEWVRDNADAIKKAVGATPGAET